MQSSSCKCPQVEKHNPPPGFAYNGIINERNAQINYQKAENVEPTVTYVPSSRHNNDFGIEDYYSQDGINGKVRTLRIFSVSFRRSQFKNKTLN